MLEERQEVLMLSLARWYSIGLGVILVMRRVTMPFAHKAIDVERTKLVPMETDRPPTNAKAIGVAPAKVPDRR